MSFLLPKPAPTPAPPPISSVPAMGTPPSYANAAQKPAGNNNKIPSMGGTLLTSPIGNDGAFGITSASSTTKKSLLGQ